MNKCSAVLRLRPTRDTGWESGAGVQPPPFTGHHGAWRRGGRSVEAQPSATIDLLYPDGATTTMDTAGTGRLVPPVGAYCRLRSGSSMKDVRLVFFDSKHRPLIFFFKQWQTEHTKPSPPIAGNLRGPGETLRSTSVKGQDRGHCKSEFQ